MPFYHPSTSHFCHGFCHGSIPKRVTVRGYHRKTQRTTAGHKTLDRPASAVVWCHPVLIGVELPNASHKPRVGRSIRPTATNKFCNLGLSCSRRLPSGCAEGPVSCLQDSSSNLSTHPFSRLGNRCPYVSIVAKKDRVNAAMDMHDRCCDPRKYIYPNHRP